jgi:sugar phosphate isomerase/epimerase
MILQHKPQLHLTYCLNVHPGETWEENFAAIKEKALAVKQQVAPGEWFGLGLRLSARAAVELGDPKVRDQALDFFASNQLYPMTVNAFPYGRFHQQEVKATVYAPDWRTEQRRDYTMKVADVLSGMLPDAIEGSISTVPGSFKPWVSTSADKLAMARNLGATAAYLAALHDDTGRLIHLGLEPEPDCYLETTAETIEFFNEALLSTGVAEIVRIRGCDRTKAEELLRRHVGVCLDTCHAALQFEHLSDVWTDYQAQGIRISKVQLSAALRAENNADTWQALQAFDEPVYLHHVKARTAGGGRVAWYDLPDALRELPDFNDVEELRVHFHVPLFFQGSGPLQSTIETLDDEFFQLLRGGSCPHLEIETYTMDVLPPEMHPGDVVKSVAQEYAWVQARL